MVIKSIEDIRRLGFNINPQILNNNNKYKAYIIYLPVYIFINIKQSKIMPTEQEFIIVRADANKDLLGYEKE